MTLKIFITYLAIFYFIYYLLNIVFDLLVNKTAPQASGPLIYEVNDPGDAIDASLIHLEPGEIMDDSYLSSGELDLTGAKRMDELLKWASLEAIECTSKMLL
ncbi:MAG: hypothetical protein EON51_16245 [Acinetobacter sp.]|nr:MAG: hypothetical protein EON51_16245 [Acinetobacter sp.]